MATSKRAVRVEPEKPQEIDVEEFVGEVRERPGYREGSGGEEFITKVLE